MAGSTDIANAGFFPDRNDDGTVDPDTDGGGDDDDAPWLLLARTAPYLLELRNALPAGTIGTNYTLIASHPEAADIRPTAGAVIFSMQAMA